MAHFGYEILSGFSALANFQYSPLLGEIKGKYTATRTAPLTAINTNMDVGFKTKSMIISHLQSELGVGYSMAFNKHTTGHFTLAYRFVKIIGARETNLYIDTLGSANSNNSLTNSVLHGLFLCMAFKYQ